MAKEIVLLEENNIVTCVTPGVRKEDVLLALSQYGYFYNRMVVINGQAETFTGIDVDSVIQKSEDYDIKLYQRLTINSIKLQVEKPKKKKPMNSGDFLEFYLKTYEDIIGVSCVIDTEKELEYKNKFRIVMDRFFLEGFSEKNILKYIKQHIMFGNYKGETIYINYLFSDAVIQNYLLHLKGLKTISSLWQNLDLQTSPAEKRKIKFLMNVTNWDVFSEPEKQICLKLYKIYKKSVFQELIKKCEYTNGFEAKVRILEMIAEDEKITLAELMPKTKHESKYLQYDYVKEQIDDVLNKKGENNGK